MCKKQIKIQDGIPWRCQENIVKPSPTTPGISGVSCSIQLLGLASQKKEFHSFKTEAINWWLPMRIV